MEKTDLTRGVRVDAIADGGKLLGFVREEDVLLVRRGERFFAVGAFCTHYHGPLAEGLVVDDQVRCPWHHACFDLKTGEALRAPALDPISCWNVKIESGKIFVGEKKIQAPITTDISQPSSVLIVGGGAAGLAAAEMLRRKGYANSICMLSADTAPPCDRPNLSKDFLTGNAPDDWIPLRPPEWYTDQKIDLKLGVHVSELDTETKTVRVKSGETYDYSALLLATGAEPRQLTVAGADPSRLFYLRSFADSKRIIQASTDASKVVVAGASFIGLEVAASLRTRGLTVDVVAPDFVPMEKVVGPELGKFIQGLHESHGVRFHLGRTITRMEGTEAILDNGTRIDADFLVIGVGVAPSLDLAGRAGLAIDRGILVNEYLETSAQNVYAAGDTARWPDARSGQRIRVEHWVVAERQGQTAAKNMLGMRERFDAVPFFWSQHYDVAINYVGHAEKWDSIELEGDLKQRDCRATFTIDGKRAALVTIGRDLDSLHAEADMEL